MSDWSGIYALEKPTDIGSLCEIDAAFIVEKRAYLFPLHGRRLLGGLLEGCSARPTHQGKLPLFTELVGNTP